MTNDEVQKLSDGELSRVIAEKLEPSPCWHLNAADETSFKFSAKRCWLWNDGHSSPNLVGYWQPRDMVNDPAMTVMLITRMVCTIKCYGTTRVVIMFKNQNKESCFIDAPIGRAVAEAFLFSLGEQ